MNQGEINPLSHHFSLSLHLAQSVSQIVFPLSGTLFLNLFVRAHLIPPLNLPFSQITKYSCFSLIRYQHLKSSSDGRVHNYFCVPSLPLS